MLSRAFRERGRATLLLGGFFACNVVRRHARGCGAAATSRALGAAADQRSRRDSGRSPRRRRRKARFCGVRRRTVRSRSGRKRYVQRVVSGRCAVRESRRLARMLVIAGRSRELCAACHMRLPPRTISLGPCCAGKRPRRCFWLGVLFSLPAHLGNVDPPPSGPLRPRIATQHGVGREETRMPRVHVGARLESRTARVTVATVAVVPMASGSEAVAAQVKYTRETRIPKPR